LTATCLACGWLALEFSCGATRVLAAGGSLGFALLGLERVAMRLCGSALRLFAGAVRVTGRAAAVLAEALSRAAGAEAGWLCSLAVDASAALGLAPIPPGPPLKLVRRPLFVTL
jgi:hypothetical protein